MPQNRGKVEGSMIRTAEKQRADRTKKNKKRERSCLILKEKNMYKAFMILAFPVMGANFLKAFNDMVDTYFVGQMPDSVSAQAGMSISWPLLNILLAFNVGLAVAGVAVVSQFLGSGQRAEAKKYSGLLFLSSVILGVLINVLMFFMAPWVMRLMGAEDEVLTCAVDYIRVRSFEMIFVFLFTAFQAVRQAQGDTVTPVILSTVSVIINIILTGIFIRLLKLGVKGAAYATVVGQAAAAPFVLWGFFKGRSELKLDRESLRFDKRGLKKLIRLAAPAAGSQALSSFGFLILQAVILDYGEEVSAAFSIGNKVSNMLLIVVMALGTVLAAFVGQNVGAGNKERAKQAYTVSRNVAFFITLAGILLLFPIRRFIVGLLSNDRGTIEVTMEYMFWVLLTQPMLALFQNYLGVFNGSGNTRFSMWMSIARLWFMRLPVLLFFKNCTEAGRWGIWYAMVISNILIVALGHFLLKKVDYEPKVKS